WQIGENQEQTEIIHQSATTAGSKKVHGLKPVEVSNDRSSEEFNPFRSTQLKGRMARPIWKPGV
nr:hypothetical protein [Endozoicomonas sp.]